MFRIHNNSQAADYNREVTALKETYHGNKSLLTSYLMGQSDNTLLLLNDLVHYPPLPIVVEQAALDAATADDNGHQDEYKADENERYHTTNNDTLQVVHCISNVKGVDH